MIGLNKQNYLQRHMMRKIILLALFLYWNPFSTTHCLAQDDALRGLVLDETGKAMGGVQVSINGSPPVVTTPTGQFQVRPSQTPDLSQLSISVERNGFRLKNWRYNKQRKELELSLQSVYKKLDGWVLAPGKIPLADVLVVFRNEARMDSVITDKLGFFRIVLPSETPVTIADFIVESRKISDGNLKFIQDNTFVYLNVSEEDQVVPLEKTAAKPTQNVKDVAKATFSQTQRNEQDFSTILELIESKRGKTSERKGLLQTEIKRLQQEIGRPANSEKEKSDLLAYIITLRKLLENSGDNASKALAMELAALQKQLQEKEREKQDIKNAKNAVDFQLGETKRLFQFSAFSAIALSFLVCIAVYFAVDNNRKKRKLEETTRQLEMERERLQQLNEELKTLMGIVAHDLKSPLNKVVGLTQLLPLVGPLNDEQSTYLGIINQVVHDGRHFIENLLDIRAIEEQKRNLAMEPVETLEWLRRSLIGYEQAALRKNIALHLETDAPEAIVPADRTAFGQIMDNLVSNAIKFSPPDKTIRIRVEAGYTLVSIAIKDEGPGISAEDQQKMFRKFQRLSARPTGGEHSSGLGLSIVKKLVEQMQGEIVLESTEGQGSTFTVYFPRYTPEETLVETK